MPISEWHASGCNQLQQNVFCCELHCTPKSPSVTHLLPNDATKHGCHGIQLASCAIRQQPENILIDVPRVAGCLGQLAGC